MIIAVASILLITLGVWLVNRILPFQVCPICAGVSGTWLWMLVAYFLGFQINLLVPAILMGGSIVGIAYQVDKRLSAGSSQLLFKSLFIPAGFFSVWALLTFAWAWFAAGIAISVAVLAVFLLLLKIPLKQEQQKVKELEEKMKDCC